MKKQFKISIPKPCHEDWSKMTQKEKGRFCGSCSKTVIDFTKKTKEEIQEYLNENFGKRVCGHFNKRQLDTITIEIPSVTFEQQLSFQKRFILALLFVMGTTLFSCQYSDGQKQKIEDVIVIDSLQKDIESKLQKIASLKLDTVSKKECKTLSDETVKTLGNLPKLTSSTYTTVGVTVVTGKPLPVKLDKGFHLDSIIEIKEEEIIIEDVPTVEVPMQIEGKIDLTVVGDINYTDYETEETDLVFGVIIEEPPKFPEAKDISREKARDDFNRRINKFFQEYFKVPQSSMEITSGKHRIISQFIIDKQGKITDIKIRTPNPALTKETERVLKKLPVFIPGKQRGRVVRTKYTFPIQIDVE